MKKNKIKIDVILLAIITFLTAFSLLLLFGNQKELFTNQLKSVAIGFLVFIIFSFFPHQVFKKISLPLFFLSLLLLILPLFWGKTSHGATRWVNLGFFSFQPSEIIKPLFILVLANQPDNILPFLLFIPFAGLIFSQPDLGTTISLSIGAAGVFLSQPKTRKIFIITLIALIVLFPLFIHFLAPFQKDRLKSFFNPQKDPLGSNYQSLQAVISIGSGQLFGRGLGLGPQSRLAFLPEYHNDLIFASLVESFGLAGGTLILLAYFLFFLHLLHIEKKATTKFEKITVRGLFFLLAGQTIINIAMNLGLLPITGITLPLVSYGGSSYVATMFALGVCHHIWRQSSPFLQERRIK